MASEFDRTRIVSTIANPTSILTRPSDTNAYSQNDLVASSTTAGNIVVPSFTGMFGDGQAAVIEALRLLTNHTTGVDAATFRIELWSAAPTFTNGDNGAYAVATGGASWLGAFDVTMVQVADYAYGIAVPPSGQGTARRIKFASGSLIYWSLKYTAAAGLTPQSGKTFTLVAECVQH